MTMTLVFQCFMKVYLNIKVRPMKINHQVLTCIIVDELCGPTIIFIIHFFLVISIIHFLSFFPGWHELVEASCWITPWIIRSKTLSATGNQCLKIFMWSLLQTTFFVKVSCPNIYFLTLEAQQQTMIYLMVWDVVRRVWCARDGVGLITGLWQWGAHCEMGR